jgi:hypothetical protein
MRRELPASYHKNNRRQGSLSHSRLHILLLLSGDVPGSRDKGQAESEKSKIKARRALSSALLHFMSKFSDNKYLKSKESPYSGSNKDGRRR